MNTVVDVRKCARCNGNHDAVLFKEFTIPPDDIEYTHYGLCPDSREPILLSIVENDEDVSPPKNKGAWL